jgi:hypothetical protein
VKVEWSWVERKLAEQGYLCEALADSQLEVSRSSMPKARVLCVVVDAGGAFDAHDVDEFLQQVPSVRFICVLPTRSITHAAYARAEEHGICVAGFGELTDALKEDEDIARHIDSQERYERRRLKRHMAVEAVRRKGKHAYELRRPGLRTLTIVTTDQYEFTVDEFYNLLESYEAVAPDLIVITNPNCHGTSTQSRQAAKQAGMPLILFADLLDGLGTRWN